MEAIYEAIKDVKSVVNPGVFICSPPLGGDGPFLVRLV